MRVLITGSRGQLGSEIKDSCTDYNNLECVFKDLPELNICNKEELDSFIIDQKIKAVINCAAYTLVDQAEINQNIAKKVNSYGVLNLVNSLRKVNGKLIHISTDYVFDGNSCIPYNERDSVNPIGIYGKSKREGEKHVLNCSIDAIIIRTSWLYSAYGNNFVKSMLRLGREKDELKVIYDQVGTPTNASDLAKICLEIFNCCKDKNISTNGKLYHFSNEGVASWYDFAKVIMELGNIDCKVRPIQTKDYTTRATRPHYSVLDKTKIKNDFSLEVPYWKDSLFKCIQKLNNK